MNKKMLSIISVVVIISGIVVWVAFSFLSESLVIKNIKSDNLSAKERSEYFQEKFIVYDYLNIFDKKNDVIIVVEDYDGFTVKYYSTRNISAEEAGYIQACIKQAGTVKKDVEVFPYLTIIHSETHFDKNKDFGITYNTEYLIKSVEEKTDDSDHELSYTIDACPEPIYGSNKLNIPQNFSAEKENSTDEWKNQCREEMYNSYIETTNKFKEK